MEHISEYMHMNMSVYTCLCVCVCFPRWEWLQAREMAYGDVAWFWRDANMSKLWFMTATSADTAPGNSRRKCVFVCNFQHFHVCVASFSSKHVLLTNLNISISTLFERLWGKSELLWGALQCELIMCTDGTIMWDRGHLRRHEVNNHMGAFLI